MPYLKWIKYQYYGELWISIIYNIQCVQYISNTTDTDGFVAYGWTSLLSSWTIQTQSCPHLPPLPGRFTLALIMAEIISAMPPHQLPRCCDGFPLFERQVLPQRNREVLTADNQKKSMRTHSSNEPVSRVHHIWQIIIRTIPFQSDQACFFDKHMAETRTHPFLYNF